MFGEGDKVVARLRINGTNNGPFAGQPPTGKKVQFDSIRTYRILDNKIVESRAMQDRFGLMEQLGLIRAAGEANWALISPSKPDIPPRVSAYHVIFAPVESK